MLNVLYIVLDRVECDVRLVDEIELVKEFRELDENVKNVNDVFQLLDTNNNLGIEVKEYRVRENIILRLR